MMVKPKHIKKEVRQSSSNGNDQITPNFNKVNQSGPNPPSTICRQSRRLNYKVLRTEPDLVDSVQYDTEWKNPYKCVACGGRFGWRLERDSHELACLDQISGQALLQMETQNNNLQGENKRRNKLELDCVVEIEDIGYGLFQKKYEGSLPYINEVDANDNYEVGKCIKNDMEIKLKTVTNKRNLSDLPSELLISFIFPKLNPSDLARLLLVNVRLNLLVNFYLGNLTCLELKASEGKDNHSCCRKNCFKFMSKMTTKLVRVSVGVKKYRGCFVNGHTCFNNQDLIRIIKRNHNLVKINVSGYRISRKVLQQLLLCRSLTSLTIFGVGLWKTTPEKIRGDIEKIKEKGVTVKYEPFKVFYL